GDAAFWREPLVQVNRAQNRAYIAGFIAPMPPFTTPDPYDGPTKVSAIKVSRGAVLALVPGSKRKPGPGIEPTYNHAAFKAAAETAPVSGARRWRSVLSPPA